MPELVALDDLDEGRTYRVLCAPKDGDPFDIIDRYQGRDGNTLIFRSHRISLDVMQDVEVSMYDRSDSVSERTISVGDVVDGLTVVRVTRDERPGGAFGPAFVVLGRRDAEHGEFWAVESVNARTGHLESGGLSGNDRARVEAVYEYRAGLASAAKPPRTGVVPSSWMGVTGQLGAEAHLQLLAAVDEAGVDHGDLDRVRRIWEQLT